MYKVGNQAHRISERIAGLRAVFRTRQDDFPCPVADVHLHVSGVAVRSRRESVVIRFRFVWLVEKRLRFQEDMVVGGQVV